MDSSEQIDVQGLAQALSDPAPAPAMLEITQALTNLQEEVRALRLENQNLKGDLQHYEPRSDPWIVLRKRQGN